MVEGGEPPLRPLWEVGGGVAILGIPDYRGSDEGRVYPLPFPYVVYRGEFLRVDGARIRELLFKGDAFHLDISLNASVPVNSRDNKVRRGMPDLDPTGEIGPSLEMVLLRDKAAGYKVSLVVPVRAVLAVDPPRVRRAGWIFTPRVSVDAFDLSPWKVNIGVALGPVFGDRDYHDYFYSVDPEFATADRPAFSARGGFSGTQLTVSGSKRWGKVWFGAFLRGDFLRGATFVNSPLVRERESIMGGFSISWIFAESGTVVEWDE